VSDLSPSATDPRRRSSLDPDDAFDHLVGVLNTGMLALMVSLGDRTGLFRTMRSMPASTSAEIAAAADLDERYVREWLAAMATGGIVVHDPVDSTFELPAAYAKALARGLGVDATLAGMCQHVAMLGKADNRIIECFRHGGGVRLETFEALWNEGSVEPYDLDGFDPMSVDHVLSLAPEMTNRLDRGIDVADICCGYGWQLNLLARRFRASRFCGIDRNGAGLHVARLVAEREGLTNVWFEQKDAVTLDGSQMFDFILTFDGIHDQARPDLALAAIARSLRSSGLYIGVDISGSSTLSDNLTDPLGVFKYAWSVMYCMTVSLADEGMGLGTMWGEERARRMMLKAGFRSVRTEHLPGNLINCYHVASVD
jgi:ubiquinone/menaquinone biosynthesis C-methylase UbiE